MEQSSVSKQALDVTAYVDWRPLTAQGIPHCYRAVRVSDSQPVEILFFPIVQGSRLLRDRLEQQLRLFVSVSPDGANIAHAALDCPNPYVVRSIHDETELLLTAERISLLGLLSLARQIFQRINHSTRSRLYHGCIREPLVTVRNHQRPVPVLNFLHRFCLPSPHLASLSNNELYLLDLKDTVDLCARLIGQRLGELDREAIPSRVESLGDSASSLDSLSDYSSWRLEPRQIALLRKLCREGAAVDDINESFDGWLEFFDEFESSKTASDATDITHPDDTHEIHSALQAIPEADVPIVEPSGPDVQNTEEMDVASPRTVPSSAFTLFPGKQFGRYRIDRLLGQGGMGAVYLGTDSASGQSVAIKVLRTEGHQSDQAIRRFHKEARLLASLQNEHVTQLIEVGEIASVPFIAMEYVRGIDLKQWLRDRVPLDERLALKAIRDIASALVEAHRRGIIHRDIKPENVMLATPAESAIDQLPLSLELEQGTLKLMDFGIAREIHQSQSMDVTRAGGILGTPRYMSPEQISGSDEISTPTDIYALGITLFEMLCGSVPYDDVDLIKIAAKHCLEPIPDIRRRNAKVSESTSLLLTRMLAKKATERPADSNQLIREINTILDGTGNDFDHHPVVPDFGTAHIWSRDFEWQLKSAPDELWPHVSNTERLNRAMGVASVDYRTEVDAKLGIRRFGSFRIGGVKVEWEEHPFEWVEGVRFGVLREFQSGPFKWFLSKVELHPLPEGGTRLVHSVRIEPRSTLGRMISEFEAGWKGGRSLDRIYQRIDESIQSEKKGQAVWDRFEKEKDLAANKLERLEQRIDRIIELGANLEAAQKLADYIRRAPVQEIAKLRPAKLAGQLNVEPSEMLDTCLVAAGTGLLQLEWDIICPTCRVAASNEPILTAIKSHTHCEACDTEFQSSIAQAIELTFRVHPEIRPASTGRYCIGGPWHAPHVVTQVRLMSGERMTLSLNLESGDYMLRTVGSLERLSLACRASHAMEDPTFEVGVHHSTRTTANISSGRIQITLVNQADVPRTVRLERTVERSSVVTAAAVSSLPRFRQLFPEQRFREDLPISAEELSLLVVQLHDVDSLYISLGDQSAYELILEWLRAAQALIGRSSGSVVRHIDGGLIAVFVDCEHAVQAAFDIFRDFQKRREPTRTRFGLGLHRGRTLIAQQDGLNDYFGSTLRITRALAGHAQNTINITDAIATDPSVRTSLSDSFTVKIQAASLAGTTLVVHTIS